MIAEHCDTVVDRDVETVAAGLAARGVGRGGASGAPHDP
jgi:hypothetical protein